MKSLLELFNPLSWVQKLASLAVAMLIVALGSWWAWSSLGHHFTKALEERYKTAETAGIEQAKKRKDLNEANAKKANDAKDQSLKTLAADRDRLMLANQRLRDSLRASTTEQTDLSACLQRSRALDDVQQAVRGFANRVVNEADKHVIDKVNCTAQWPQ